MYNAVLFFIHKNTIKYVCMPSKIPFLPHVQKHSTLKQLSDEVYSISENNYL